MTRQSASAPNPTILFDSWTSQLEVQDQNPPRLETLFGLLTGNGWTWSQTTNPITTAQLQNSDGSPIPGVLVIPTRYNLFNNPDIDPNFSPDEQKAIVSYVNAGGSLLHMTNHSFFSKYDAKLAANFGITLADQFLKVPGVTVTDLNRDNPVLAGSPIVQSVCAHDGCLMTVDADNPNNPVTLASFVPVGQKDSQLFALTMTPPGGGRIVYVVNSGWIGDYGTGQPAWGLMPYGNNLAFILSILGWLLHDEPTMEPVSYEPPH